MKSKSISVQRESDYSEKDFEKAKKLVAKIKDAKKDPSFIDGVKRLYKHHTGKSIKL
ncbi:MAG: hypothetical protein Q7K34_00685 [archaeon]|nr:hypothetical protein [archaeon]